MRIEKHLCDGCMLVHEPCDLTRYSNGKGSFAELCEACVRKAVLRALKREVFILRTECDRCHRRGVVHHTNKGMLPCPTCCQ